MKAWIILITASLIFGVICGIKIKNIFVGVLISGIVPITVFSAVIIYEEYFMPYQGGGASMWPIAILFGGTAAAFIGATGYIITIGINKLLNKSSNKSLKNGTPPIGGAPSKSTRETLSGLSEKEIELLRMRFGIDFNKDKTLEEVAKQYGITIERIREIERKAMKKLGLNKNDDDPDDNEPDPA